MDGTTLNDDNIARRFACWDGSRLALAGFAAGRGSVTPLAQLLRSDLPLNDGVPELDAPLRSAAPDGLLWPLELLLQRPFALPLQQPRLIDSAIMREELSEQLGDELCDDHWLAWHAVRGEQGVHGVVVGLPEPVRRQLTNDPLWQRCEFVVPDGWARLCPHLPHIGGNGLIFEQDRGGLFVGAFAQGGALGMRRLNLVAGRDLATLIDDAQRSLAAMGQPLPGAACAGRLTADPIAQLVQSGALWQGETIEAELLPERHQANLAAAARLEQPGLNFRHGAWRGAERNAPLRRRWRRTASLAAMLSLLFAVGVFWQQQRLQVGIDAGQQRIEVAFHRGLPGETVMLDPLAQLRAAAGGRQGGGLLPELSTLAKAMSTHPGIRLDEVAFGADGMRISGHADDFAAVEALRTALAQASGRTVAIDDSESDEGGVRFRIHWL